jgi:hypothetical protein
MNAGDPPPIGVSALWSVIYALRKYGAMELFPDMLPPNFPDGPRRPCWMAHDYTEAVGGEGYGRELMAALWRRDLVDIVDGPNGRKRATLKPKEQIAGALRQLEDAYKALRVVEAYPGLEEPAA